VVKKKQKQKTSLLVVVIEAISCSRESEQPKRTYRDMAQMGYMLLFTADDCIEPSVYATREEDKVYAPKTPFWMNEFLVRRREDPKVAMNNRMIAVSTTSTSIPLGLFQRSFAQFEKDVVFA